MADSGGKSTDDYILNGTHTTVCRNDEDALTTVTDLMANHHVKWAKVVRVDMRANTVTEYRPVIEDFKIVLKEVD